MGSRAKSTPHGLCRLAAQLAGHGTHVCRGMLLSTVSFLEDKPSIQQLRSVLEAIGYTSVLGANAVLKARAGGAHNMTPLVPELFVFQRGADGKPAPTAPVAVQVVMRSNTLRCVSVAMLVLVAGRMPPVVPRQCLPCRAAEMERGCRALSRRWPDPFVGGAL